MKREDIMEKNGLENKEAGGGKQCHYYFCIQ